MFFQNVDAIVGPDEPIIYPEHLTEELDYELELAVVLRKAGKWFGPEEAMDYIAGYVIFNDITARDIQRREMRSGVFSFCKAIDTFCPLGPWIVTPDEIPDPHDLTMELRVNGETAAGVALRAHVDDDPGDPQPLLAARLSAPATCSRPARSRAWPASRPRSARSLYLKPGDVIEAEIERIGVLRNPVVSWQEAHGEPAPPRSSAGETLAAERDDAKLDRVRALMAEQELDALVVRAPDNVLYLTNFWGMKGYDACVFPREGEPVLICLEASAEDAARTAWTTDVRLRARLRRPTIRGRCPRARSRRRSRRRADYGRVGLELSLGTQATDRMVGEPTTFTKGWFDACPGRAGREPLLVPRAVDQDGAGGRAACGSRTRSAPPRWSTCAG